MQISPLWDWDFPFVLCEPKPPPSQVTDREAAKSVVDFDGGLTSLPSAASSASSINEFGSVTGSASTAGDAATHAFVYSSSRGMVDLNSHLRPGRTAPGFYLSTGVAINENCLILAGGSDGHAYLLKPYDE